VSQTLPKKFDDQRIRLYCKTDDKNKENQLRCLFKKWCDKNQFLLSSGSPLIEHREYE